MVFIDLFFIFVKYVHEHFVFTLLQNIHYIASVIDRR